MPRKYTALPDEIETTPRSDSWKDVLVYLAIVGDCLLYFIKQLLMTTKLKPVEEVANAIWNAGGKLTHNQIDEIITQDRHTIYTALREGIKQEKFKHEEGSCYMCQCKTYDKALDQTLTLLDELFGVSK